MFNPYQTPAFDPRQFQDQPAGQAAGYSSNWVSHIRIFSVLNAVQGILETLTGLGASAIGVLMPFLSRMKDVQDANADGQMPPEQFLWIAGAIYLAIGVVALTSGILRIVAGVQNYRLKNRVLGLASIIV